MFRALFPAVLGAGLAGCSYMGMLVSQADYVWHQKISPEQRIYKHMLDSETFFVFGKVGNPEKAGREAIAVIAVSDRFSDSEVVDVHHALRPDSHYSLHLPAGDYRLLAVSDLDGDGYYRGTEVVGERAVSLTEEAFPDRVLSRYDIDLRGRTGSAGGPFRVRVVRAGGATQSLFYPNGTVRALDDPIFSPQTAALGMYEPGAFLETAPLMFYALEEDFFYKVPVVFVHGIGGNPREFSDIVSALDRTRYRPWFFYYPSGSDLNHIAATFHTLFLSGKVLRPEGVPIVIVAHSMGGLVAREALNLLAGVADGNRVARLITLASPLGGISSARLGEKAPVVVPVWRDINPDSRFIRDLYRNPLPDAAGYHLLFAYGDDGGIKLGDNSDGVVALASQLSPRAQEEAVWQRGFDDTHTGILKNREAVREIARIIGEVRAPFPEAHLRELAKGGYGVELTEDYTPLEAFYIRNMGFFMEALASGKLEPVTPSQERFVRGVRGEASPEGAMETGWLKFVREFPERGSLARSRSAAGRAR